MYAFLNEIPEGTEYWKMEIMMKASTFRWLLRPHWIFLLVSVQRFISRLPKIFSSLPAQPGWCQVMFGFVSTNQIGTYQLARSQITQPALKILAEKAPQRCEKIC